MQETLAERLFRLRNENGFTQEVASEKAGVSRVALTRYENGQRMPKMNILAKLAECYGVTVDYLMGRDEPQDELVIAPHLKEDWALFQQLTPEEKDEIVEMMKFKLYQREKK